MDKPMKRFSLALLLGFVVACGGGGSDPADPNNNQNTAMVVPNGTFALTSVKSVDGCGRPEVWDGDYEIQIAGKTFTMGEFTGSWDATKGFARGETEHGVTVTRNCTLSDFSMTYLTFEDKDTFHGTISYKHTLKGSCPNLKSCTTTWIVNGTRVTP
jgi:hypothetical protein